MGRILHLPEGERTLCKKKEDNATLSDWMIVGFGLVASVAVLAAAVYWAIENLPTILHHTVVYLDESFSMMRRFNS